MKQAAAGIALFTLAGIATAPGFMDPFREELSSELRNRGYRVVSKSVYPFGDWSQRLVRQLAAIFRDLTDIQERLWSSIGAGAVREAVWEAAQSGCTVLLVGHSGGGVSAVQLARQLTKAGYGSPLVVQIGSPKCPVSSELKDRVLYLSAMGSGGKKDPVSRLGRWGGWVRQFGRVKLWKSVAYSPGEIVEIPLVGNHPDYFRTQAPYVNETGDTNMTMTLRPILSWLDRKLP
ncbi:hypothetical protein [Paenibacillus sp. OAS669]|uniref:hypothetical protein n=1 Tax=Paenibacillus sp. OAS669 TaxID=2663821 RepID=UPI0017897432|nr:hypothetical protein [Paenibacillus sp. OAS669]MBE1442079.1 hypothetical protein [Paenibacillus sp. OAS669]